MIDPFTYFIYLGLLFLVVGFTYIGSLWVDKTDYAFGEIRLSRYFKKSTIYHLIALILISFLVGFRFEVGVDWGAYVRHFNSLDQSISLDGQQWEWGYFAINKIIAVLGGKYTWMFFIVAFISWYFVFKSVPAALLPLVLFFLFTDEFLFWSMNGVRQFVTLAIFLYAVNFIIQRELKIFLILIFLGALFHYSILFLIPLYFIPYQKLYNQKVWIIAFIISLIFSNPTFLVDGILDIYTNLAEKISFIDFYLGKIERGKFGAQEMDIGLGFIFKQLVTVVIIFLSKPIIEKYPQTKIFFVLFFFGAIFFNLFYMYPLIGRFIRYLTIFRPIALALIVSYLWERKNNIIGIIPIITLYFFLYLVAIYTSSNMCSPYNFAF